MAKYNDVSAGQTEACINRMGGWENFLRFIGGQGRIVFDTILTLIRTVRIPAQPAVTTSADYFKEAGVAWMSDNFQSQFLGLEVEASERTEFAIRKLEQSSLGAPILVELGDKAETPVSQFKAFLAGNRESSEFYIFYLKGKDGNLWVVSAYWNSDLDGWHVYASSVGRPLGWDAGSRVVSRN